MLRGQNLRRFLIAGVAVGNEDKIISCKCDQVCRASELPIYIYEESTGQNKVDLCKRAPGVLENAVSSVRKGIWTLINTIKFQQQQGAEYVKQGTSSASSMVKYLSEESSESTRMGAVGLGAFTGYLLGLRGGLFRRVVYAGVGAVGMCALCYPKETYDYSQIGLAHSKRLVKITYNFVYGVNGSNKEEFNLPQLPELPSSLDEAWQIVGDFGKSATNFITGKTESGGIKKESQNSEILPKSKE